MHLRIIFSNILVFLTLIGFGQSTDSANYIFQSVIITSSGAEYKGKVELNTLDWIKEVHLVNPFLDLDSTFNQDDVIEVKLARPDHSYLRYKNVVVPRLLSFPTDVNSKNEVLLFQNIPLLLLTVVSGNISLLEYSNKNHTIFFYLSEGQTPVQLENRTFILDDIYGNYRLETEEYYREQILEIFSVCGRLNSKFKNRINRTKYSRMNLKSIFAEFHTCMEEVIDYELQPVKGFHELGILTGVSISSLNFNSQGSFIRVHLAEFDNYTSPNFGLYHNFGFGKQIFQFRNELYSNTLKFEGESVDAAVNDTVLSSFTFDIFQIRLNNLLRVNLIRKDFNLFLDAGISQGFSLKRVNLLSRQRTLLGNQVMESDIFSDYQFYDLGWTLGLGIGYKRFSVFSRLETHGDMTRIGEIDTEQMNYYILFSYKLF